MNKTFQAVSSASAILAGVFAFAYAYFFVIAKDVTYYSFFLLLLGIILIEVVVALYGRLKNVNEDIARVALVFGVIGAAGMAIHGGYDLANAINPPALLNADLPNQVDPRGLLAFGFTGLAIFKFSWLMSKDKKISKGLAWLGFISGILLVIIYIARLTVLDPTNPILLYPVLINGFILNPLWYLWIGIVLKGK